MLRAFVEVAKARSVGRAAAKLGYSPSAVSRHVMSFERSVGEPVFLRQHGGMYLNGRGEQIFPLAVMVVTALAQMVGADNAMPPLQDPGGARPPAYSPSGPRP